MPRTILHIAKLVTCKHSNYGKMKKTITTSFHWFTLFFPPFVVAILAMLAIKMSHKAATQKTARNGDQKQRMVNDVKKHFHNELF